MSFFTLRTPRDMFQKAEREHVRLQEQVHIDSIFNFFVTAHHIRDYVLRNGRVPQKDLEDFLRDPDLQDCRDLCDKGKHLTLTKRPDPKAQHIEFSGCIGGAPIGAMPIGGGSIEYWTLTTDSRSVDVKTLADAVLKKWSEFLLRHGL